MWGGGRRGGGGPGRPWELVPRGRGWARGGGGGLAGLSAVLVVPGGAVARVVIEASPFDEKAYDPYAGFLRELLSRRTAPQISDLMGYPQLARMLLPRGARDASGGSRELRPDESIVLVFLTGSGADRTSRDAAVAAARGALADLQGATL